MKLATLAIFATLSFNAMALDIYKVTSTSTKTTIIPDSEVERVWSGSAPACLKDGGQLIGFNKAGKNMGLKYRDCSQGDAAVRKHKALGYSVTVIKLSELSDAKIREVMKRN